VIDVERDAEQNFQYIYIQVLYIYIYLFERFLIFHENVVLQMHLSFLAVMDRMNWN